MPETRIQHVDCRYMLLGLPYHQHSYPNEYRRNFNKFLRSKMIILTSMEVITRPLVRNLLHALRSNNLEVSTWSCGRFPSGLLRPQSTSPIPIVKGPRPIACLSMTPTTPLCCNQVPTLSIFTKRLISHEIAWQVCLLDHCYGDQCENLYMCGRRWVWRCNGSGGSQKSQQRCLQ